MNPLDEPWVAEWFVALNGILTDPAEAAPPPVTPGGGEIAVELDPEAGVKARIQVPEDAPGGAATIRVFVGSAERPDGYPEGQVFVPHNEFVLNEKHEEERVVVQFRGIVAPEDALEVAVAQSLEEGWVLTSREEQRSPHLDQTSVLFRRGLEQRHLVVAAAADASFLLVEDSPAEKD